MALVLATDLGNGYSAEYYRITEMTTDMSKDTCYIRVSLYKDQATREASLPCAKMLGYSVDRATIFDKAAETVDNPLHAGYTYLKTLPELSGAADA